MLKRAFFCAVSVVLISDGVFADSWKIGANSNLLLTLNSFSDNWIGGAAGSFVWTAQGTATAEKQISLKVNNKNTLKLAFGQTKTQNKESKHWSMPTKSTDLIDLESLFKFTLGGFIDPYGSVNMISQFSDQRNTALVRYFNPFDIKESFGAIKGIVKNEQVAWNLRLGAAARQIIDRSQPDVVNDGGAELVSELKANSTSKLVQFVSTLKLYEAIISSRANALKGLPGKNDWRHPHLNWENVLTLNVAKYLMFNIYAQLLYDKPLSNHVRLKETVSLGLTYSFAN